MKKIVLSLCAIFAGLTMTGCASLIDGGKTSVTISTNAPDATVIVRKSINGLVVSSGKAPHTVQLKTANDILKPATYMCDVIDPKKKKQTRVIETSFNPLFLGNFIFGNLIGMAIDVFSGSCYRFDKELYIHFSEYDN